MTNNLKEHERLDDLHRNGYRIIQNEKAFCFGMDAVLLSGYAAVRERERAADLGTGTGIIPILLEAKTGGEHFTGLEIEASQIFGAASFDVVTTNPPYMNDAHGLQNPDPVKAIARHEVLCTLEDVVREGAKLLVPGGRFYMVHRPHRLVEIINTMTSFKLEPKRIKFVHPFVDKEANMVLIEGIKGGKSMIKVEKPIIVYKEQGVYTDEIYDIYGY